MHSQPNEAACWPSECANWASRLPAIRLRATRGFPRCAASSSVATARGDSTAAATGSPRTRQASSYGEWCTRRTRGVRTTMDDRVAEDGDFLPDRPALPFSSLSLLGLSTMLARALLSDPATMPRLGHLDWTCRARRLRSPTDHGATNAADGGRTAQLRNGSKTQCESECQGP